jgi:hypothetical protein
MSEIISSLYSSQTGFSESNLNAELIALQTITSGCM